MNNIAVRAARNAGNIIVRSLDRLDSLDVSTKDHHDYVSEVDRQAEQAIIDVIKGAYPSHAILAEESGLHEGDEYQWVIDPLDGTTNFLHGFPQFAVSIALLHNNQLDQAVIYDPLRQELFTASRGRGARLNNRRIRVSAARSLDNTLIGTGFPYKNFRRIDAYMDAFKALLPKVAGVRRPGSAALDLAYVAAGRLDGFWEMNLQPWDIAAGVLLVQEAGGLVTDLKGGHEFMASGDVVAANPKVMRALLPLLRPHFI